jgi:hypothetical protein
MVSDLCRASGLNLRADLKKLTETADLPFEKQKVASMLSHSQPKVTFRCQSSPSTRPTF